MHVLRSGSLSGCFTSAKGTAGVGSKDREQEESASLLCDRLLHKVFKGATQSPHR